MQDGYSEGSTLSGVEDACIESFEIHKTESQTTKHQRMESNDFQSAGQEEQAGLDCLSDELIDLIKDFVPKDEILPLYETNERLHSILEEVVGRNYYFCASCKKHIHFKKFTSWIPTEATLPHHKCGEIVSATTTCRKYPRVRF